MSCCPQDSLPFLAEDESYQPKGEVISNDEFSAYIVNHEKRDRKKCLIFIHDIFGLHSGYNKFICDALGQSLQDYIIIAPDFFPFGKLSDGAMIESNQSSLSWKICWLLCCCKLLPFVQKCSWDNIGEEIFNKVTRYIISEYGGNNSGDDAFQFAIVGNCWGAYIGFRACHDAEHHNLIKCNVSCHPSVSGLAGLYEEKEMDIVKNVRCPQLILSTRSEPRSWKPSGVVETTLKEQGVICEFHLYQQETHGFFTRGNKQVAHTKQSMNDCLKRIITFVQTHCR